MNGRRFVRFVHSLLHSTPRTNMSLKVLKKEKKKKYTIRCVFPALSAHSHPSLALEPKRCQ